MEIFSFSAQFLAQYIERRKRSKKPVVSSTMVTSISQQQDGFEIFRFGSTLTIDLSKCTAIFSIVHRLSDEFGEILSG
jgi:hypothetical protein